MSATKDIAEFICGTGYDDLPPDLLKHTKNIILSEVGMTVAGVPQGQSQAMINYVKERGAPEEAGVWGASFRTSIEYAVLANSTISHATELEDDSFPEGTYMVAHVPTPFAFGERMGLSGKQVIEALIIGYEVASRTALASVSGYPKGFAIAPIFGSLGNAAATAKILGLGIQETMMAISIAASQSGGLIRQTGTGAHLAEAGFCARNGISAALLAQKGLTGQPDIIEGNRGLCYAVAGVDKPELKLGSWRIRDVGVKEFPCCFLQMHIIGGFLELRKEHNISADDVESIQVDVNSSFLIAVRYQHPANEDQARFSLPHSIAACFLDDKVFLDSYTNEKALDPKFHAFRDKVKIVPHDEWNVGGLSGPEIPIVIRLKDSTEYKKVCPSVDTPIKLSDEQIMDKYMDCTLRVLSRNQANQVAEMVLALEDVKDVSELVKTLTFPEKQ